MDGAATPPPDTDVSGGGGGGAGILAGGGGGGGGGAMPYNNGDSLNTIRSHEHALAHKARGRGLVIAIHSLGRLEEKAI